MPAIKLNTKRCKGCFLCVSVCPAKALSPSGELSPKGYETVKIDEDKCLKCGTCYRICPDYVFEITD
jgi:2-oxoglutarate ferredoxin oxidoreductase subunit delta